ncbi:Holliday junction resolvase [Pseudomonas endophytica]|uniref:Holliday junction resolvase n=1 Tax=Pseudomonas endophytica TaxID=1563157 RepID=A0A0Q0T2S1_9PSED|nr:Holliday junction resolvase [Pseudomonas endophytica]
MDSWKTLAIVLLASVSTQAVSGDNVNPVAAGIFITLSFPTILIGATTSLTTEPPEILKSSKSDALAFIGSDGEIRGAEFEQASRYYRSTYNPPLMSDMQLAQAIASSF